MITGTNEMQFRLFYFSYSKKKFFYTFLVEPESPVSTYIPEKGLVE
jgi:hypothetical protein